jgi:hypothetical protein
MKKTSLFTLVVTACVLGTTADAAQPSTACDRECLRGKVRELLYAFVKHDVSKIKVAPTLRVTEDAIVKPLASVGLVQSVTGLAGYRQDIIDERMGIVWLRMAWGVAQEGGDQLCVWETFKIHDGQMHAVEAFMRTFPIELRNGGWE